MDWDKASVELSKKLNPSNVQPPKQFGPKGSYIEGWLAIQEANRIFGFGGWSYTILDCKAVMESARQIGKGDRAKDGFGVTYVATVRVTVGDVTRDDVGSGHGYDVDLGLAHESAIKESVTDALKRSLRSFGNPFGLALYDKSRENVGVDEELQQPAEPEPADVAMSDRLVAAIQDKGADFAKDPAFAKLLAALRKNAPGLAARVDVVIETRSLGQAA